MHTEVNVVDNVLFTKSHVNDVVTSTLEIVKMHKKKIEQHFQDVAQKFTNNTNLDYFAANFAKHFTQKSSPQQCCKIISF